MPAERTIMRQVREVLRLKFVGGVPIREIARRIGVAASTVRATIRRFQAAGLSWPLSEEMTDAVLEAKLFADAGTKLVPTFPQRSPPSLLTTAACGGLRSTPDCRPRRALLHLSYSYAPPYGPALLVTQCHNRTHAVQQKRPHSMTHRQAAGCGGIVGPSTPRRLSINLIGPVGKRCR